MGHISHQMELIKFDVGERSFCVDADQVLGLVTLSPHVCTPPPFVPFNNEQIPVFSLDRLLEFDDKEQFPAREILVFKGQQKKYGIAVGWVGEIHRVSTSRAIFRFPESRASRIKMFGIWGAANLGGTITLIIEPECLIAGEPRERFSVSLPNVSQPSPYAL